MNDTTRDAFEAWARYLDISTEQDGWQGLIYTHSHVQAMWEGWQAATLAAKRQPLTDKQLRETARTMDAFNGDTIRIEWKAAKLFARAIEAAHGIKA